MLFKMVSSSSYRYLSLLSILLPSVVLAVPALDLETRATNAALPQSLQDCLKATNAQLSYPSDSNYGDLSKPENSALKASPLSSLFLNMTTSLERLSSAFKMKVEKSKYLQEVEVTVTKPIALQMELSLWISAK